MTMSVVIATQLIQSCPTLKPTSVVLFAALFSNISATNFSLFFYKVELNGAQFCFKSGSFGRQINTALVIHNFNFAYLENLLMSLYGETNC